MDADFGELIVRWTARLAVAAYALRLIADLHGWPEEPDRRARREQLVRSVWTAGGIVYVLHVAAAFHFVHHWSHTAAVDHTARQTGAVTGWHWGGGLWINDAFTLWWPLDIAWSWRRSLDRLPRWYVVALHTITGFLMFNATVVFGPPWWRWAASALIHGTALTFIRRLTQTPQC
ncbi:MAG: hypothetical protein AB7I48_18330 [Planctomycetaceae bacterium]